MAIWQRTLGADKSDLSKEYSSMGHLGMATIQKNIRLARWPSVKNTQGQSGMT